MEQPDLVGRGVLSGETAPVSRDSAEHYEWGDGCDGWHLVKTGELSVIEERMPPGAREERHFHVCARQFFYVLSGELTMELEGSEHVLGVGVGIEVAPGLLHQAINRGGVETRFLVVSQPRSRGDRFVEA